MNKFSYIKPRTQICRHQPSLL
uniref:Uncharacterized protein n=1 Tax=Arundo donax TaxID=35708 RepID=A0A0A9DTY6_ARUDO